jgi:hypothetical protein
MEIDRHLAPFPLEEKQVQSETINDTIRQEMINDTLQNQQQ